jgi:hypothetical protein
VNLGIDRKREIICAIQNPQFARQNLNVSGGEFRIFRPWQSRRDLTSNLDDIFTAQCVGLLRDFSVLFRAKYHLGQAFAVAQVDKNHATVIAGNMNPAGKRHLLADVSLTQ